MLDDLKTAADFLRSDRQSWPVMLDGFALI